MEDTLIPTKPEDFVKRYQTDPRLLQKEVEYILNPDYHQENLDRPFEDCITEMLKHDQHITTNNNNSQSSSQQRCTCPKRIQTKKRAKKKNLETIGIVTNGYMINHYCPIHSKN